MRNNQFNSLVPFVQIVDDLFSKTFHDFSGGQLFKQDVPAMNVLDLDKEFRLELAVPGLDKNDFQIHVENDYLVISADKKEEKSDMRENYSRKEFSYRAFKRMFEIPENADRENITAKYENGILNISLQKITPVQKEVKSITIE